MEAQINSSEKDYENRLKENPKVAEEHFEKQKRVAHERAKIAQEDLEKEHQLLK